MWLIDGVKRSREFFWTVNYTLVTNQGGEVIYYLPFTSHACRKTSTNKDLKYWNTWNIKFTGLFFFFFLYLLSYFK